jgi:predicted SnoaL-like aldol condensation-catalyzing enzyme
MRRADYEVRIPRPYCGLGRPKISRPLFATLQHSKINPSSSRSSSSSSSPSSTPSVAPLTAAQLRALAIHLLDALANTHDLKLAASLIAHDAQAQHEDNPAYTTRASFLGAWQVMLDRMPDFRIDIVEAVADERERKVWIRGFVTVSGNVRDCTTMMVFDEEGLCVRSWDQSRATGRRRMNKRSERLSMQWIRSHVKPDDGLRK